MTSIEELNAFTRQIESLCDVSIPKTVRIKGFDLPGCFLDLPAQRCVASEIVKALPNVLNEDVAETLIRYLAGCPFPYEGKPLTDWYDKTTDASFRWAIANTLSFRRATIDIDWLRKTMAGPAIENEKQMLFDAIARYLPTAEARLMIEKHFDEEPLHAVSALLKLRNLESIPFLEAKANQTPYAEDRWYQWRIPSVIEKIRNRPRKANP